MLKTLEFNILLKTVLLAEVSNLSSLENTVWHSLASRKLFLKPEYFFFIFQERKRKEMMRNDGKIY